MAEVKAWPLNMADYAYNAEDVQRWMAGKTSGVYGAEGNWQVIAAGGMGLTVKAADMPGGWLSNSGRYGVAFWNDTDIQLTVPIADGTLSRVDRVVVSWHIPQQSTVPTVAVRTGTPSTNPVGPALVNDGEYAEICLAEIRLSAGQTTITASNISDTRMNEELCGLVSAGLDKYPTDGLEAEFRDWFENVKTDLSGDVAANLLNNIETHKYDTTVHLRQLTCTKSGTVFQLTGLGSASGLVNCTFKAPADFADTNTFTVDGTPYTIQLSNGDAPANGLFVSGATLSVVIDTVSKKINFKSGGPRKSMVTEIIAATQEWTVPAGVKSISVRIFGAGGGGGQRYYGYGGGGGEMAYGTFNVTPGTKYTVTIGKGGYGNANNANGGSGGASSFGTLLSAAGGGCPNGGTGGGAAGVYTASDRKAGGNGTYGGGGGSVNNSGSKGGNGGTYGGGGGGPSVGGGTGGQYGGNGGSGSYSAGASGTNTIGKGLEFEGTGAGGSGSSACGGGGGGYGGVGGNAGSNYGGGGGGGGYGAKGGNGGQGVNSNGGGGGGGGGYGGPGGNGGKNYYYKPSSGSITAFPGVGGGGGGYGPSGKGGNGGDAGDYGTNGESGGVAAGGGGGGGGQNGYGRGGDGGNGVCVITYIGYR